MEQTKINLVYGEPGQDPHRASSDCWNVHHNEDWTNAVIIEIPDRLLEGVVDLRTGEHSMLATLPVELIRQIANLVKIQETMQALNTGDHPPEEADKLREMLCELRARITAS